MDVDKLIEQKSKQMQKILNDMLSKIKIVVSLPVLLKRNKVNNVLKDNEMHLLRQVRYYYKNNFKHAAEVENKLEDFQGFDHFEMEYKLSYLLEILNNNCKVHQLVDEYLLRDESSSELITSIELYKKYVEEEMKMSPKVKVERDMKLQSALINLKSIESEMNTLKNQLQERKDQHENYIAKLSEEIEAYESKIEETTLEHRNELIRIVNSSEDEMEYVSKYMESQKFLLNKKITIEEEKYKQSEEENLITENALLKLCGVAEEKYLNAVALYDKEIGSRDKLKENLQSDLSDLIRQYEELENNLTAQEPQYSELKEEKELIILQIFTERLENFEKNRAARIIQRNWRAHRERMALRKKKKSKRK